MNWISFIRIFLLSLIIIGIGLLVTQKMWVPKVVDMIIKFENRNIITQTIVSSPTVSIDEDFSVPDLYPKYSWDLMSDYYQGDQSWPILNLSLEVIGSNLSPRGSFYVATNTDPGVKSWNEMVTNSPKDEPIGFYGGDEGFSSYYEKQLNNLGYSSSYLNFDKDLNVTYQGKPTYTLGFIGADGPTGNIRGYVKYNKGKIRVIIISTNTSKNSVFVSDIIDIKNLIDITKTNSVTSQCQNGKQYILLPSSEGAVVDDPKGFCMTIAPEGKLLVSKDGIWTAQFERGDVPISYDFKYTSITMYAGFRLKLENVNTKEKKIIGVVNLTDQKIIADIKKQGENLEFEIPGYLTFPYFYEWSNDGHLWGRVSFVTSADPPAESYGSIFEVNPETGQITTYILPPASRVVSTSTVFSDQFNVKQKKVLYGNIGKTDFSLEFYDYKSATSTVIASYPFNFLKAGCFDGSCNEDAPAPCNWENKGGLRFICSLSELQARWIDDTNISYIDLYTNKPVIYNPSSNIVQ